MNKFSGALDAELGRDTNPLAHALVVAGQRGKRQKNVLRWETLVTILAQNGNCAGRKPSVLAVWNATAGANWKFPYPSEGIHHGGTEDTEFLVSSRFRSGQCYRSHWETNSRRLINQETRNPTPL